MVSRLIALASSMVSRSVFESWKANTISCGTHRESEGKRERERKSERGYMMARLHTSKRGVEGGRSSIAEQRWCEMAGGPALWHHIMRALGRPSPFVRAHLIALREELAVADP